MCAVPKLYAAAVPQSQCSPAGLPDRTRLHSPDAHADCDAPGDCRRRARSGHCLPGPARPGRRDDPSRGTILASDSALRKEDWALSHPARRPGKYEQCALPAETVQGSHYRRGFQAAARGRGATDGRGRYSGSGGDWGRHDTRSIAAERRIIECLDECGFDSYRDAEFIAARCRRRYVARRISQPGTRRRYRRNWRNRQFRVAGRVIRPNLVVSNLVATDKDGPVPDRPVRRKPVRHVD